MANTEVGTEVLFRSLLNGEVKVGTVVEVETRGLWVQWADWATDLVPVGAVVHAS